MENLRDVQLQSIQRETNCCPMIFPNLSLTNLLFAVNLVTLSRFLAEYLIYFSTP
jgi:hypothetical protein